MNYTTGYIEGFYGKILNWQNRKRIVDSLSYNKMNTYFYAPKEDINHRLDWRKPYNNKWRHKFKEFAVYCKKNNINIIAGIAPGIDFNFNTLLKKQTSENDDLQFLINKARQLLNDGATSIALLMDDIPNHFKKHFGEIISEGVAHANLANKMFDKLNCMIYFVPRIYADELIENEPSYLPDLGKYLYSDIKLFYCGKNVISKNIIQSTKMKKIFKNKIIYWDNFYSNDYCPRRFFIGPLTGRNKIKDLMINPTGLICTDLLILDIVAATKDNKEIYKKWLEVIIKHGVPSSFKQVKRFFLKPDFTKNPALPKHIFNKNDFAAIDHLLWKWKNDLSREWYPYLFGLKHDLQLQKNQLTSDRIIKTQTLPLAHYIKKDHNNE